jgi:nicotinamide-nucleotide amidase
MTLETARMPPLDLFALSEQVGSALQRRGAMLATAESCTGGWIAQAITSVAGSSDWFERGFVTYSDLAKQQMLGVRSETLAQHGAVSEQAVCEMAAGALRSSEAQIAVAVSGIAGPSGGTPEKPVGTVWFAWVADWAGTRARVGHFAGDRDAVRRQAVGMALQGVLELLEG